jgi:hypothetical protein
MLWQSADSAGGSVPHNKSLSYSVLRAQANAGML